MIQTPCPRCQRALTVKDELAGKKIKCPGCQGVIAVPGGAVLPDAVPTEPEPGEEGTEIKRKSNRSKKGGRRKSHSNSGGHTSGLVKRLVLIGMVTLIVGGVLTGTIYLIATYAPSLTALLPKGPEGRRVSVYSAFRVRARQQFVEGPGAGEGLKLGGSDRILVIQDYPEGTHLFVSFTASQKHLIKSGCLRQGAICLTDVEVELLADGKPAKALFLTEDYGTGPVAVRLTGLKSPDELLPGSGTVDSCTQSGTTEDNVNATFGSFDKDGGDVISASGRATFKGKSGLSVFFAYAGQSVNVTWNASARGWYATRDFETAEQFSDSIVINCVFADVPRDAKDYTIRVAGKDDSKVTVP
jgi:hypothetical protein